MDEIEQFAHALEVKLGAEHKERFPNLEIDTFSVERGQKFDRIVEQSWNRGTHYNAETEKWEKNTYLTPSHRSVHAFAERATGNVIKAAGWKAPAKSKTHPSGLAVRFNIATPAGFKEAIDAAGLHNGYLYAK